MDTAARFSELIDAFQAIDPSREPDRARALIAEATRLVDRGEQPKKWAALRAKYAELCGRELADDAIDAYRDALTVFTRREDASFCTYLHAGLGQLLFERALAGNGDREEALQHLQEALPEESYVAPLAAWLWSTRTTGDPYDNWRHRRDALEIALAATDRGSGPEAWAKAKNDLAVALGEEPGAEFHEAIEARLRSHREALQALADPRSALALEIRLQLSEGFASRTLGDRNANREEAAKLARDALADCDAATPPQIVWRALLAIVVALDSAPTTPAARDEMSALLDRAAAIAPPGSLDEATIRSFRVNLALERIRSGDADAVADAVDHARAALAILDPERDATMRASIGQRLGEAHAAVGDFVSAQSALSASIADREQGLARAVSLQARREALFALGESAALAAWCALRRGQAFEAIALLERGRSRLWRGHPPPLSEATLAQCVPSGGAILFPVFAGPDGVVVIVVREAFGLRFELADLPRFGREQMLALQRGSDPAALGGWLLAYARRHDDRKGWERTVAQTCETLNRKVWLPVLARLRELGIADDAELAWLPQGGSGVFPMHAAAAYGDGAKTGRHAIRYASSLHALSRAAVAVAGETLMVVNPTGDLRGAELEFEWIRRATPQTDWQALQREQATRDAVLARLAHAHTAHLGTHAVFDVDDAFASRVMLACGGSLTLAEWLPLLAQHAPSCIVLSACDTAVARVTSLPDEAIGFPTALVEHGVRGVVATLWAVDDLAAALVMASYYEALADAKVSRAQALRHAQQALRTIDARSLAARLKALRSAEPGVAAIAASLRSFLQKSAADARPFAEPVHWAPFVLVGE